MDAKKWFKNCIAIILLVLVIAAVMVAYFDPFFHYHAPLPGFYYVLDEQRSQNNGITRHFDYDAIITGTSMTENFKTSELDDLFGVRSVKLPYAGATYRELNENLKAAFATHDKIRMVVRSLDMSMVAHDPDTLREDMGSYPDYLYDDNPVNDVKYLFNRDVIFRYCGVMLLNRLRGVAGGVTDFDTYSYTGDNFLYDGLSAFGGEAVFGPPAPEREITQEEYDNAVRNIREYVCALAIEHPETEFYYFIPPYSMVSWGREKEAGTLGRTIALYRLLVTEVSQVENIHLYAFGTRIEITAELTNYHDPGHYGPWINSLILQEMREGTGRITQDNAEAYLAELETLVRDYDYDALTP